MRSVRICLLFVFIAICVLHANGQDKTADYMPIDYYGQVFKLYREDCAVKIPVVYATRAAGYHTNEVLNWYAKHGGCYDRIVDSLLEFRRRYRLNDWLYYQLIRKVAYCLMPKEVNYPVYTLYKWILLARSGYDARVATTAKKVIFYVRCDEDIADIPFFLVNGRKYMCLNYHDYAGVDLNDDPPAPVDISISGAESSFSYKITRMPEFGPGNYQNKKLSFQYKQRTYHFNVRLNTAVQTIFANYPGVDFETYFNIPISHETYSSLITILKKVVKKLTKEEGVDYLMRFTRYAFLYKNDEQNFGREKRMSPEETLLSAYSDCDDRAALFFYLVKEIYNLPMIALLYPSHITMAVEFEKPIGKPIPYNGKIYSVCEPTPEIEDLSIGQVASNLNDVPYHVVYQYEPKSLNK